MKFIQPFEISQWDQAAYDELGARITVDYELP
jgi:hypothetical protein